MNPTSLAQIDLFALTTPQPVEPPPPVSPQALACPECGSEARAYPADSHWAGLAACTNNSIIGQQPCARVFPVEPPPSVEPERPETEPPQHRGTGARRARLERKAEKRLEWAEGREGKASALRAQNEPYRGDWAFATQPGYIPERARANRRDEKAHEHQKTAAEHRSKAAGLERQLDGSIYSDDSDAPEALRARIAEHEATRERMKTINKLYRKGDAAGLAALGLDLEVLRRRVESIGLSFVKVPYEGYQLSNLGGRIAADRKRLASIERQAKEAAAAEQAGGMLITRHAEHNWCSVRFAEKPDRSIIGDLKGAGFRWGAGAWSGYLDKIPASVLELEQEARA